MSARPIDVATGLAAGPILPMPQTGRDELAEIAMPIFLAWALANPPPEWAKGSTRAEFVASQAYEVADAMIKERRQ